MGAKQRLDVLLVERGLINSRELARRMIMAGEVTVNGQIADKPGTRVAVDAALAVRAMPRFVSRGGDKLEAAITAFAIPVAGKICADVGASTGGFTDCLLQHGAAKVYALDVGYGQIDYRLRQDARVIVMERTNARYVESLPDRIDIVTIDASFISLRLLLPVIREWLADQSMIIALIKPQFEAGRDDVGKGGVVKQPEVHRRVLQEVIAAAQADGFTVAGLIRSPLKGPAGNIEFLVWLLHGIEQAASADMESLITQALSEP
ncbi:MAG: TlyA family RNA methyltransferase [Anaerolineae bacterium]|nr:TlyA family RNA methyltransferase [Anaerolineae bacterium]